MKQSSLVTRGHWKIAAICVTIAIIIVVVGTVVGIKVHNK